ncbi:UDP-3-O-acyl-N-acetylglucosamine deacetylase [Insolitispirillum peregrinum]|uniref:UDP-3-O-acyl-N-acetylglucosamine deacetylase n=1 Tax=Insolitispirillum peregrinum TaxID=80876 RepID=UPI003617D365
MVYHSPVSSLTDSASSASVLPLSFAASPVSQPSKVMMRKTLKNPISCSGIGLHCGQKVSMTLNPASAGTGVVFRRTDPAGQGAVIPADWSRARISQLCTTLADEATGATVGTVEHLLAALAAMGIDDILIDINGPEVPAMDGSSAPFVFLIECAGTVTLDAPRQAWKVLKPVVVEHNGSRASLIPGKGLVVDFEIDFAAEAIGRQSCTIVVTPASFKDSVMRARTFGLVDDLPKMRALGLGLGGSLDNAVVVNGAEILNDGGLRYPDEFVRHKALDAIGDLSLAGLPIIGHYSGYKSSHALNGALVQALLNDPTAVARIDLTEDDATAGHQFDELLRVSA